MLVILSEATSRSKEGAATMDTADSMIMVTIPADGQNIASFVVAEGSLFAVVGLGRTLLPNFNIPGPMKVLLR